jgi:hypothetical protein
MPWWHVYFPKLARTFPGELWTVSEVARDQFGLAWILGQDNVGLSPSSTHIHTGRNSGYQAIGLAYLFGAANVVLLGFDFMLGPGGERHHHGEHPPGLSSGQRNFQNWRTSMNDLAADLRRTSCKVLNASRRTALKCFPRVTLETALNDIRNPDRTRDAGGL